MSDSKRLTFRDASSELGVTEEALEKLVAEGKISSIKEGDTLYFKREVIEAFKSQNAEPAILLTDEEINLLDDEDDVDFGIDLEEATAGGKTDDLSLEGDDAVPDLAASDEIDLADPESTVVDLEAVLEDDAEQTTPVASEETSLLEDTDGLGDDTLLDTDVLDLGEDETDTFDLDTAEETLLDPTEEGTLLRGGGARVMQMKRKKSHAVWTAVLAVGALFLLVPMGVLLSMIYTEGHGLTVGEESFHWIRQYNYLADAVTSLAKMFQ